MKLTKATNEPTVQNEEPRIEPIENPESIKLKLAYWFTKKKIGKVVTPLKVVQARLPNTLSLSQKLVNIQEKLSITDSLAFYIKSYVATLNGCTFCIDIAKAEAENNVQTEKYEQLLNYRSSDLFTSAEKAALEYVEQATKEKEVSDEVFDALRAYFNDTEIVEITLLNAIENFYNLLNKPLQIGSDNLCSM